MTPQVSIIILNYNTPELTTACVQSIIAHTSGIDYEVVLVDNGSANMSKEYFDTYLNDMPNVRVFYTYHNRGFGWGNNYGYELSKWDYLFFLNSDTIVYENSIGILYHHYKELEKTTKVGFLAPRLYYDRERTMKQIFGTKVPRFWDVLIYNIPGLKKIFKRKYEKLRYGDRDRNSDKEIGNAWGPAFFCSRECFETIGKFDERFFLYMEEFDTAMRLKKNGYHNFFTAKTSIVHLEDQSPKVKRRKIKTSLESMMKFFRKYKGF